MKINYNAILVITKLISHKWMLCSQKILSNFLLFKSNVLHKIPRLRYGGL
jgi:hypothetical protein